MGEGADRLAGREIILEWIDYGDVIRVNAVDAETGVEASATGPRAARRVDLERLALGKLARRLFDAPRARPGPDDNPDDAPERGRKV
jgi:hypothetical protein